jgi:hypothetical protein
MFKYLGVTESTTMDTPTPPPASQQSVSVTRRRLLAAGGLTAAVGLGGCLGRVATAATNTGAAPAAHYSGDVADASAGEMAVRAYGAGATDVRYVPATIRGGSGLLSGEVTIEGWVTTDATKAQDYNSSRSNRPRTEWWDDVGDADSDADGIDDADELAGYLDGDPTIGERFTVCLPDARLPGVGVALGDELTPRRLVEHVTGRSGGSGGGGDVVWSVKSADESGVGDCDDSDPVTKPGAPTSDRPSPGVVCPTNLLGASLSRPSTTGSGLVARSAARSVVVTNLPTSAEREGAPLLAIPASGESYEPDTLDDWGPEQESDGVATTATFVCPMYAKPEGCPAPIPALFHVRRCRHDGQYLYTGGWIIDDGILYEDSRTLLVADGPPEVVAVTADEVTDDRYGDAVSRRLSRRRSRHGSTIFRGLLDSGADYLPDALRTERGESWTNDLTVGGSEGPAGDGSDDAGATQTTVAALDAPLVHLDGAGLSTDVKFKAGAELSKAVA